MLKCCSKMDKKKKVLTVQQPEPQCCIVELQEHLHDHTGVVLFHHSRSELEIVPIHSNDEIQMLAGVSGFFCPA